MWMTRSRLAVKPAVDLSLLPRPERFDSAAKSAQAADDDTCVIEETIPQDKAFQMLFDGHDKLKKRMNKVDGAIEELTRMGQDLHETIKGVTQDMQKLDAKISRVHDEIKRHEQLSDDEKEAGRRESCKAEHQRYTSVVKPYDS